MIAMAAMVENGHNQKVRWNHHNMDRLHYRNNEVVTWKA